MPLENKVKNSPPVCEAAYWIRKWKVIKHMYDIYERIKLILDVIKSTYNEI